MSMHCAEMLCSAWTDIPSLEQTPVLCDPDKLATFGNVLGNVQCGIAVLAGDTIVVEAELIGSDLSCTDESDDKLFHDLLCCSIIQLDELATLGGVCLIDKDFTVHIVAEGFEDFLTIVQQRFTVVSVLIKPLLTLMNQPCNLQQTAQRLSSVDGSGRLCFHSGDHGAQNSDDFGFVDELLIGRFRSEVLSMSVCGLGGKAGKGNQIGTHDAQKAILGHAALVGGKRSGVAGQRGAFGGQQLIHLCTQMVDKRIVVGKCFKDTGNIIQCNGTSGGPLEELQSAVTLNIEALIVCFLQ